MGKSMLSIAEAGFGYVFIPKSFSKILSTTTKWQPDVSVQLPFERNLLQRIVDLQGFATDFF
jgi:hypothetical protein